MSTDTIRTWLAMSVLLCPPLHGTPPIPGIPLPEVAIRIPAPPGLPNPSRFGIAVAIEPERLFVGCDGRRDGPPLEGKVLVFEPDEFGSWAWTATLVSPESQPGDEFGSVLAMDGHHLVIGAPGHDGDRGAAWCLDLTAPDDLMDSLHRIPIPNASPGDRFGESLAVRRGAIAVGAPRADVDDHLDRGRVVTSRVSPRGVEHQGEPAPARPKPGLRFGWSLAIGTMLDIGAPGADAIGPGPGKRIDRAGVVVRFEIEPPHDRVEAITRSKAGRLERFGSCLSTTAGEGLLVGSPRAVLDGVRSGVVSLVSPHTMAEIGDPHQPESGFGEPLVGDRSIFIAGIPGRRDADDRPAPGVRLGRRLSQGLVPAIDLLLEDRRRTLLTLALSRSGRILAIGTPDPAVDDGPEVPGEVHLVRLEPMLRRAK